ncbi:hypothetical protein R6Q57_001456 [Mikania cordata]
MFTNTRNFQYTFLWHSSVNKIQTVSTSPVDLAFFPIFCCFFYTREYKVKDTSLADFGRLELELAEVEMPGLTSCRSEFGPSQPFKGPRITGSLHMTSQTGVLIKTLTALGAEVR